jgi:hypothetical protein
MKRRLRRSDPAFVIAASFASTYKGDRSVQPANLTSPAHASLDLRLRDRRRDNKRMNVCKYICKKKCKEEEKRNKGQR